MLQLNYPEAKNLLGIRNQKNKPNDSLESCLKIDTEPDSKRYERPNKARTVIHFINAVQN